MSSAADIGERLDRIEHTLEELRAELAEIRRSTPPEAAPVVSEATAAAAEVVSAPVPAPTPAAPPTPTAAAAWRALERGRELEAVELAGAALELAVQARDSAEIDAIATFAAAATDHVAPELRPRLAEILVRTRGATAAPAPEAAPPEPVAPVRPATRPEAPPAPAAPVAHVAPAAPPPAPAGPPLSARVHAWARRELTGVRLFALGGGTLMLLGVVFLFVVAANRGWIGPGDRVVLGAVASAVVLLAGLLLRRRYGRVQASLAAVGVGIAGAYTTLAAATILYGLLPSWVALLLAAAIAAVGASIALAWSSELLAGLALVGAAAAPGLVALDEGISAPAPAFALVVLAAALAAAAPRRWLWLVVAVGSTALVQVVWLVAGSPAEDAGALAVSGAASLLLLAGAVVWQATAVEDRLDSWAATMALLGAGLALSAARTLLPDRADEGVALAVMSVVYGAAAIASGRRLRDLGWVVGAAALVLAGVATADLLSGRSLTIAFAVQAVVLAGLARRLESTRFEAGSFAYLALGIAHVVSVELEGVFRAGDVPRAAAPALFTLAAAALLVALALPGRRGDSRSTGVASALEPLWDGLVRARPWLRFVLATLAVALAASASAGILSGRWLTIAWAVTAAAGGVAAWRMGSRGLELVALAYLAFGVAHLLAVDLEGAAEAGDVPRAAASVLFSLALAALIVGVPPPARRAGGPSSGMAEALAPLWDGLVGAYAWIRALLVALAVALAAAGAAALVSGRWLTITWAAAAAVAALAARGTAERRLLAVAAPGLALAALHALSVEAPTSTLVLERGLDALGPIPSLAAVGTACVVLALTYRFDQRGIRFLGPLEGPERMLAALERVGDVPRTALLRTAAGFGVWIAGLALVDWSYEAGQVAATFLWALLGLELVARNARLDVWREAAGWVVVPLAYVKAVGFDWDRLGDAAASTSVLGVALALLALGFATRWVDARATGPLELLAIGVAGLAGVSAVEALTRLTDGDDGLFGASMLVVAATLAGAAVPPFVRWRSRGEPPWARTLATGYWALALAALLLAEAALSGYGETRTLTLWAATGAILGLSWRVVGEPGLWIAALLLAVVPAAGVIAFVTPLDRLVDASSHPAGGVSALLVCVAAAVAVAWRPPAFVGDRGPWLAAGAGVLGVYAFSLLVLEVAERVSGASIETDFQRGHTALSTLLGIAALGVYVVGLAREQRLLRIAGLTLFGLALAKLFLYDLSSLSSITRALSFLALGAVLLAAAFFAERLVGGGHGGTGGHAGPRTV